MTLDNGQICFDRFLLDPQRRQVLADGKALPVQSRAFDLLEFLVRHHERPVSRDEILTQVFKDVTVLPSNVSVQVHALRSAFRKAGCSDELILTLNQQRYQFIGELSGKPASDVPALAETGCGVAERTEARPLVAPRRHFLLPALAFGLALGLVVALQQRAWFDGKSAVPAPRIMVLPFTNKSSDIRQDDLVDAVTDNLIAELRRDLGCNVIARGTAAIYRKRNLTARETGRAVNVRYLVDGTVQPDGNALKISAWLTDTETETELGDIRFSIPREQLANASDVIVSRIASSLNVTLIQSESDRPAPEGFGDPDVLAYHNYYRARSILDRHAASEDYEAAQKLLEAAVEEQKDFVAGLAELGWVLVMKMTEVDDHDDAADEAEAKQVIARALSLEPRNPRALAAQGRIFSVDGDFPAAIASAQAALAIEPNRPDAQLALAYAEYYSGHLDEAKQLLQAMIQIDPEGPASNWPYQRLGMILLLEHNPAAAIQALRRSLAGDIPPEPGAGKFGRQEKSWEMIIAATEMQGDHASAHSLYMEYADRWRFRTAWRLGTMSPAVLASSKNFRDVMDMLVQAGMPRYADEQEDAHLEPTMTALKGDVFAATPQKLPVGNTLTTQEMVKLTHDSAPKLIIDIGHGSYVMPEAVWHDIATRPGGNDRFVESLAQEFAKKSPGQPIVLMGDGTFDIDPYNAAVHLISLGYPAVAWYRGGEEAWAKYNLPVSYRRKN